MTLRTSNLVIGYATIQPFKFNLTKFNSNSVNNSNLNISPNLTLTQTLNSNLFLYLRLMCIHSCISHIVLQSQQFFWKNLFFHFYPPIAGQRRKRYMLDESLICLGAYRLSTSQKRGKYICMKCLFQGHNSTLG